MEIPPWVRVVKWETFERSIIIFVVDLRRGWYCLDLFIFEVVITDRDIVEIHPQADLSADRGLVVLGEDHCPIQIDEVINGPSLGGRLNPDLEVIGGIAAVNCPAPLNGAHFPPIAIRMVFQNDVELPGRNTQVITGGF
jgi:hypothetical protein